MVYTKYITKNGKKIGPYYYKSVRGKDGKVRSVYIGHDAKSNASNFNSLNALNFKIKPKSRLKIILNYQLFRFFKHLKTNLSSYLLVLFLILFVGGFFAFGGFSNSFDKFGNLVTGNTVSSVKTGTTTLLGKDTYISNGTGGGGEQHSERNFGGVTSSTVGLGCPGGGCIVKYGLFYFNLSTISPAVIVRDNADTNLSLYCELDGTTAEAINFTMHPIIGHWEEGGGVGPDGELNSDIINGTTWMERYFGDNIDNLTAENDPADWNVNGTGIDGILNDTLAVSDHLVTSSPVWFTFNSSILASYIQGWINGSYENNGVIIELTDTLDRVDSATDLFCAFTTMEGTEANWPMINIDYASFPNWNETSQNSTNIPQYGQILNFNITVFDDINLSSLWLATNDTGEWINQTPIDISNTMNESNYEYTLINTTGGMSIGWAFYFNDSEGDENVTDIQNLNINEDSDLDNVLENIDRCLNTPSDWKSNITAEGCAQGPGSNDTYMHSLNETEDKDVEIASDSTGVGNSVKNYGENALITAADDRNGLFEFNLSFLPINANLTYANFTLYNQATNAQNVIVYILGASWLEGTGDANTNINEINGTTWVERYFSHNIDNLTAENDDSDWFVNGSDANLTISLEFPSAILGTNFFTLDITHLVQGFVNESYPNYGLMINATNGAAIFVSGENTNPSTDGNSTTWPNITIEYTIPGISADITAPVLSVIANSSITSSGATITWTTDEDSNSTVYYGTTVNTETETGSATLETSHSVALSSLSASTVYYYNVSSCDSSANCNISEQENFTTSAAASQDNPSSGGSSGGGGGGSSTPAATTTTTVATSEIVKQTLPKLELIETEQGQILDYEGGRQIIKLSNSVDHIFVIDKVSDEEASFTLYSEPISFTLKNEESKEIDINSDKIADVKFLLVEILSGGKVNVQITKLSGAVKLAAEEEGRAFSESEEVQRHIETPRKKVDYLYIVMLGGAIVLGFYILVIAVRLLKKKKKGTKSVQLKDKKTEEEEKKNQEEEKKNLEIQKKKEETKAKLELFFIKNKERKQLDSIKESIKQNLDRGFLLEDIKKQLVDAGYSESYINQAVKELTEEAVSKL